MEEGRPGVKYDVMADWEEARVPAKGRLDWCAIVSCLVSCWVW